MGLTVLKDHHTLFLVTLGNTILWLPRAPVSLVQEDITNHLLVPPIVCLVQQEIIVHLAQPYTQVASLVHIVQAILSPRQVVRLVSMEHSPFKVRVSLVLADSFKVCLVQPRVHRAHKDFTAQPVPARVYRALL